MQAKHTSFPAFTKALVKIAGDLSVLAAEAGPWLTQEGEQGIEELCRALREAHLTVSLPVSITPDLAKVLAGLQSERQRKQSPRHVQTLRRDVAGSSWALTGDSLKVDAEGVLRDGGHRTEAIIQAGRPVTSYVAFGVDPEAVHAVDAGKVRTPGETLHMSGVMSANAVAAVALRLWAWDNGFYVTPGRPKMSKEELLAYTTANPWLQEAVTAYKGKSPAGFPASVFITAAVLFARVDAEAAGQFMTSLATGANLPEDSPILYLLRKIPRGWNATPRSKRRSEGAPAFKYDQVMALLVAGWNRWRDGKPVPHSGLYLPVPLSNKNFPMPH